MTYTSLKRKRNEEYPGESSSDPHFHVNKEIQRVTLESISKMASLHQLNQTLVMEIERLKAENTFMKRAFLLLHSKYATTATLESFS